MWWEIENTLLYFDQMFREIHSKYRIAEADVTLVKYLIYLFNTQCKYLNYLPIINTAFQTTNNLQALYHNLTTCLFDF